MLNSVNGSSAPGALVTAGDGVVVVALGSLGEEPPPDGGTTGDPGYDMGGKSSDNLFRNRLRVIDSND